MKQVKMKCDKQGCSEPSVTNLDSENLCQKHADEWVRGEGAAAAEYPDCDGKEVLVRPFEVAECLLLAGLRYCADEIKLAPKRGQFRCLPNISYRPSVSAAKCAPVFTALFQSKVVNQPNNACELGKLLCLFIGWVQPIAKRSMKQHGAILLVFCLQRNPSQHHHR